MAQGLEADHLSDLRNQWRSFKCDEEVWRKARNLVMTEHTKRILDVQTYVMAHALARVVHLDDQWQWAVMERFVGPLDSSRFRPPRIIAQSDEDNEARAKAVCLLALVT